MKGHVPNGKRKLVQHFRSSVVQGLVVFPGTVAFQRELRLGFFHRHFSPIGNTKIYLSQFAGHQNAESGQLGQSA